MVTCDVVNDGYLREHERRLAELKRQALSEGRTAPVDLDEAALLESHGLGLVDVEGTCWRASTTLLLYRQDDHGADGGIRQELVSTWALECMDAHPARLA